MCGRYSFATSKEKLNKHFGLSIKTDLEKRYNIDPTQKAYVIMSDSPKELKQLKWGLVPHWANSEGFGSNLINARSEGISSKPSFRLPIRRKRCLVLADSFYEWKNYGRKKMPHRIVSKESQLMVFAGIWDEWKGRQTFTIITTTPNEEMKWIHGRMPVILPTIETQQKWLSNLSLKAVLELLKPMEDNTLRVYPVSDRLNKVDGHDAADLWTEVKSPPTLFDFTK
ncbi:MAG: putative SOS response-associated peptidase YedK [Cognaticolwellia sp.]|jgi:putative SOS response-associated peptidase YedK